MKRTISLALLTIGILAVALGLVWIGRGTAYFPWPEHNFMVGQMQWAWRGAALVAIGAVVALLSRRN